MSGVRCHTCDQFRAYIRDAKFWTITAYFPWHAPAIYLQNLREVIIDEVGYENLMKNEKAALDWSPMFGKTRMGILGYSHYDCPLQETAG